MKYTDDELMKHKRNNYYKKKQNWFVMAVQVGSILSVINYILSINIFTLVSWVSLIGLAFKFLRKEYVSLY